MGSVVSHSFVQVWPTEVLTDPTAVRDSISFGVRDVLACLMQVTDTSHHAIRSDCKTALAVAPASSSELD